MHPGAPLPAATPARVLILVEQSVLAEMITLTLNHGVFVARAAPDLARALPLLDAWHPLLAANAGRVVSRDQTHCSALGHATQYPCPGSSRGPRGSWPAARAHSVGTGLFDAHNSLCRCGPRAVGGARPVAPRAGLGQCGG